MSTPKAKFLEGLNAQVYWMGLISFLADVSSEMLYPITPIFLTSVLGAPMMDVGAIEGLAEGLASLLKGSMGRWSDRSGHRRRFVFVGYLLTAFAKPMIGWAGSWPHVLAARSVDRVGKGVRGAPRDALLAEAVEPRFRGKAFGWHRGMDTLGAVLGPLLALWFLTNVSSNLRQVYFWAFIPGVLAAFTVFLLRETSAQRQEAAANAGLKSAPLPASFKYYLFSWGLFSLGNSSDAFLILRVKQSGATLAETILLYCLYNVIYAFSSPVLGSLSDSWGRKRVLVTGLFVFALVYFGFGYADELWHFASLYAIYGLYMGATDGVGKAYAVDLLPKEAKGAGLGWLGTVTGVASLFASLIAGWLWDKFGMQAAFHYGAALALVALLLIAVARPMTKSSISN